MRVIDLLNKIANGEETHFDTKLNDKYVRVRYYNDRNFSSSTDPEMLTIADIIKSLNDEVEIIEDKIDKDIKWYFIEEQEKEKTKIAQINMNFKILREKLTEIIDKLNEMEKE